jgi:uncharacterized protein (TIGR02444 family)
VASEHPLWHFSLAVYRMPGVSDACLRLQDDAGADVNLLLYFCWLATVRDAALDEAEIRRAVDATADWRDQVVRPLRGVRRWMKDGAAGMPRDSVEGLRSDVKRVELESEQLQQDLLFRLGGAGVRAAAGGADARARAEENIARYFKVIRVSAAAAVDADLRTIFAAAIPD